MNWYDYPVTHGYVPSYQGPGTDSPHYAEDIGTPFHTPLTALLPGTVKQADYQAWGGELFIQPDAGGPEYYYYHPDEIDVRPGQHVQAGQLVALSGGQLVGGEHPASPQWSSGPHTHVGFFSKYISTPVGSRPYGPDILPLIQAARIGNLPAVNNPPAADLPGGGADPTAGAGQALDVQGAFARVGLFVLAALLVAGGLYMLLARPSNGGGGGQDLAKLAKLAVLL